MSTHPGPQDCHIHLHHSPCTAPEMTVEAIATRCQSVGLAAAGLVNHLHPHTADELFVQARREVAGATESGCRFFLGIEAELLDQQGTTTLRDGVEELAEYTMLAMGHVQLDWVHLDLTLKPGRFLEREAQSLITALDRQRVDVVAHPFLYALLYRQAPDLAFALRPHSLCTTLLDDLAEVMTRQNVLLEYHCRDLLLRPQNLGGDEFVDSYLQLLQCLLERGVRFAAGSDAHRLDQIGRSLSAPDWAQQGLFPIENKGINDAN